MESDSPAGLGRPRLDLATFSPGSYSPGRSRAVCALWWVVQHCLVRPFWVPNSMRLGVLRLFGAKIGTGVVMRSGVYVHWPWRLTVGSDSWIGHEVYLHSLDDIVIGSNVCISQQAMILTGSHKFSDPSFPYDNGPVRIYDGVWLGARTIVLRGSQIPTGSLVAAGTIVHRTRR